MKRKMKAVAALSLAAVMLLAGCGSSKGTQDGGSTTAADTAARIAPELPLMLKKLSCTP